VEEDRLDKEFQQGLDAARKSRDPNQEAEVMGEWATTNNHFQEETAELQNRHVFNEARRYLVPIREFRQKE
jgi:hypothetical protein